MTTPTPDLELILAAQAGDIAARNELVMRHERFIWKMVREALGPRRQRQAEEYFSCGVEGIIRAIEKFDPAKAGSLLTYAGIAIKSFVWRELVTDTAVTRTRTKPTGADDRDRWNQASRACAFAPGVGDAAQDAPIDAALQHDDTIALLNRYLSELSPLEQSVLHMLYHDELPRDQIGRKLGGLSRERIDRIEAAAFRRLRQRGLAEGRLFGSAL
jgi:RNA polymerase sporulation-specific sigma factor